MLLLFFFERYPINNNKKNNIYITTFNLKIKVFFYK
ncbi:hypothetical protein M085_4712, partial [Bacteroides fragilis str. 3986 N(B)19]